MYHQKRKWRKKSRRGQLANHSHMEDGHQNGNGCFLGKHFNQVPSKFHFIIKKTGVEV